MPTAAPAPSAIPGAPASTPIELSLRIEGMTCASCINRIERFLRKTQSIW